MKKKAFLLAFSLFAGSVITPLPVMAAQSRTTMDQTADQLEEEATGEEKSTAGSQETLEIQESQESQNLLDSGDSTDIADLIFSVNQNATNRMFEQNGELYYDFDYREGRALNPNSLLLIEVKNDTNPHVLVVGKDYEISYDTNAECEKPGTDLVVTVTGKGNYTGTKIIHMRIPIVCYVEKTEIKKIDAGRRYALSAEELNDSIVDPSKADQVFQNNLQITVQDVIGKKHTLTAGTDYTLEYYRDYTGIVANIQFQGIYQRSKTEGSNLNQSNWNRVKFPFQKIRVDEDKTKEAGSVSYDGKTKKPNMSVYTKNGEKLPQRCYNLTYSNNVNPGKANVRVQIKEQYRYMIDIVHPIGFTTTFQIEVDKPKDLQIESVNPTSTSVSWKGISKKLGATYQVQYSTDKNFKKNVVTLQTKGTKKQLGRLKTNKTYYVHVRSCITQQRQNYYSRWSKTERLKTKK